MAGDSPCWGAGFSYARCCDVRQGPRGDLSCWRGDDVTYEGCCLRGEEVGPIYNELLNCGGRFCRWASPQTCWNETRPARLAREQRHFSERCIELCCGGYTGYLSRAALSARIESRTTSRVRDGPRGRGTQRVDSSARKPTRPTPDVVKRLETTRRCHLHTASALFCEYEHLCVARSAAHWAIVFLRPLGSGILRVWTPLQVLPSQLAFNEARSFSVFSEPAHLAALAGGAMSVVLPSGFWWPALSANDTGVMSIERAVVGWSQPAAALLKHETDEAAGELEEMLQRKRRSRHGNSVDWFGYADREPAEQSDEVALVIGLDPAVAPRNIFHFAQLVLPAFAARVRLSWQTGKGSSSGLLRPPPAFRQIVLADPLNASGLPWQRGLLDLVAGASWGRLVLEAHSQLRGPGPAVRCFRRAVLPGMGMKDRAVPSTGRADHAALVAEAARRVPGMRIGGNLGQNIVLAFRDGRARSPQPWPRQRAGPGQSRVVVNQAEVVGAILAAIHAISGREACSQPRAHSAGPRRSHDIVAPCILEHHGGAPDFASQVRRFSSSALLVGVTGAAFTNMIFMPPESVVLVLQPPATRDYYVSMAIGCGHFGIPFFVECIDDPRADDSTGDRLREGPRHARGESLPFIGFSARMCKDDSDCLTSVNDLCDVRVDVNAFLPVFATAFSHAFAGRLAKVEFAAVGAASRTAR